MQGGAAPEVDGRGLGLRNREGPAPGVDGQAGTDRDGAILLHGDLQAVADLSQADGLPAPGHVAEQHVLEVLEVFASHPHPVDEPGAADLHAVHDPASL